MSTARDRVEAQRAGYVAGKRAATSGRWNERKQLVAQAEASKLYPAPTYERPRTVTVPSRQGRQWDVEYKVEDGILYSRCPRHPYHNGRFDPRQWKQSPQTEATLESLLGLFVDPTETVEVQ